jgi:hypothetical protein
MKQFGMKLAVAVAGVLAMAPAWAVVPPDQRCEAGKLKLVASYALCRLKVESSAVAKNEIPDYSRCEEKFNTKFPKLEVNAGAGVCPSEGDVGDIRDRSDDFTSSVAVLLSGGTLPTATCGDGLVAPGEDCDVGNLDGETCASQGFYNGALACGPGCGFDTSGCHATRFEDNVSTVLDHETGLEWEKKDGADGSANLANAHDVDNSYTWAVGSGSTVQNGTIFTDFLVKLNGTVNAATFATEGCYAAHCDWRLPTLDELKSIAIVASCGSAPCVQDALLTPILSARYWTISSRSPTTGAWFLDFSSGAMAGNFKTFAYAARAVRSIR